MRRKEKEIKEQALIDDILKKANFCFVAMCCDNSPYMVPMNFGYDGKAIYLHSALDGEKINILKKNNEVFISIVINTKLIRGKTGCNFSMRYESVSIKGKAVFLESEMDKTKGLECIMKQYDLKKDFTFKKASLNRTNVIRVDIVEITGKCSRLKS